MIDVRFQRDASGDITSFTMKGHAESGPYGYDLVCAGASAVSFGTVNAVYELTGTALDVEMEDGGMLAASLPDDIRPEHVQKIQTLLEGLRVSMQTMEEQYGQFIQVTS